MTRTRALASLLVVVAASVACSSGSNLSSSDLRALAKQWLRTSDAPGVVVGVLRRGRAPVVAAAGLADRSERSPMRPTHRFHIGSITKTFVAAATLQLVDEGKVRLDDPLGRYLRTAPSEARDITIRELLAHRSGLPDPEDHPGFARYVGERLDRPIPHEDVVAMALEQDVLFRPGERFDYSNTNYLLLGLLVEQVTGRTLATELRERFVEPLGLSATALPDLAERPRGLAAGSSVRWARYFDADVVDTTTVPQQAIASVSWAQAGIVSDAADLLRWAAELYSGDVLSDRMRKEMVSYGASSGPYGLGTYRFDTPDGPAFGHGGEYFGYRAEMRYLPGRGIAVVALANSDVADLVPLVHAALRLAAGGDPSLEPSVDDLIDALRSPSVGVRQQAALDLGTSGSERDRVTRALSPVLRDDESAEVRAAAALALGLVGGERATEALHAASDRERDPEVQRAIAAASARISKGTP